MKRRHFLRGTALAAVLPSGCASMTPSKDGFIDAHVHVWTPDTRTFPLAAGFSRKDMVPESFTPGQLLEHCRPEGVKRVVLIQMSFYQYDNRYMLDAIAGRASMFRGVAIVDDREASAPDTMSQLAKQGVRGFRLYTSRAAAESWSQSANMKAMWTRAADQGLAMCLLAEPEALPAIQKMCQAFPKTRVVIDHFARLGMRGPVSPRQLDQLCRLADSRHAFVKTSAFYALGKKKAPYTDLGPMISRLREAFGPSRLMWASDCPYQVEKGHRYADSIALIRDRLDFLSAEDKAWMLRKTAERVFFT